VEQIGRRKGYRLGPTLYVLARGGGYRADLVATAEPQMRRLAAEVRETVLLAVLRGRRRFTLVQFVGTQDVQVRAAPDVEANVYETATGRLLLAHAATEAMEEVVSALGLPGDRWPGVVTRDDLDAALAVIRAEGRVVTVTPTHVAAVAWPVWQDGQVAAALGLYLPEFRFVGEHRDVVLAGMARTAEAITRQLARSAEQPAGV
jgi:DNA-binding IclR family transcriptional regulator